MISFFPLLRVVTGGGGCNHYMYYVCTYYIFVLRVLCVYIVVTRGGGCNHYGGQLSGS